MRAISLAAGKDDVYILAEGRDPLTLSPEVAETLGAELPRFAAIARVLASSDEAEKVSHMADYLGACGLVWDSLGEAWKNGDDFVVIAGPSSYAEQTRALFTALTNNPPRNTGGILPRNAGGNYLEV